jgi:hypothetical protein
VRCKKSIVWTALSQNFFPDFMPVLFGDGLVIEESVNSKDNSNPLKTGNSIAAVSGSPMAD